MIRVDVWLPDPASVLSAGAFGAGALIRLESGPAETGPFAEITTIAVVGTTVEYTFWDTAGDNTTWYRWRVSKSDATLPSPYSDPFPGTSPTANVLPTSYADLGRLLTLFSKAARPTTPEKLTRLSELLSVATDQVIQECGGRDYFRHPATGTAVWTLDGDGSDVLHIHEGLVSLTLLELSFDGGFTFVPVNGPAGMPAVRSDYLLTGDSPYSLEPIPAGEPYFHIKMTGFGQYVNFVPTVSAARLTGVGGWPAFPPSLVEGTAQRARQLAYAEGSYSGSMAGGPDEFGHPATTDRFWPQSMYNFLTREHERFMACHIGSIGNRSLAWQ
ncbi:MAG: hypothetical protein ACYDAK_05320 [Candidatus Limnocylindrales bacterium]